MRLAGNSIRHTEEMANILVLWKPTEGRTGRGRRRVHHVDNLLQDAEKDNVEEERTIMEDSIVWKKRLKDVVRNDGRTK